MSQKLVLWFRVTDLESGTEVLKTNDYWALCKLVDDGIVKSYGAKFEIETPNGTVDFTGRTVGNVTTPQPLQAGETYRTLFEDHGDHIELEFLEKDGPITEETHVQSKDGDFGFGTL